jgi:hypothetical protein
MFSRPFAVLRGTISACLLALALLLIPVPGYAVSAVDGCTLRANYSLTATENRGEGISREDLKAVLLRTFPGDPDLARRTLDMVHSETARYTPAEVALAVFDSCMGK